MSLLIKNIQIVDGEGSEPYKADVLIQKNLISAIGNFKSMDADETIDGLGNYLAPGFIDIDTSSDQYLSIITNPEQSDFLKQGVTTIVGGHCGSSLAPLLYGSLESVRKWTDTSQINVNWHTLEEFLKVLDSLPIGVNFGTLVGHSTIRRSINGGSTAPLTSGEMKAFVKILRKAMEDGAFGLSTGLGYAHGRQILYSEIDELVSIVSEYDGIYSTHLRSETTGLISSVEETIRIAEKTGVKALISHLRPLIGFESQFNEAMSRINNFNLDNLKFYSYPFDASLNPIYTLLPLWAQEKDLETMIAKLRHPETLMRIEIDLQDFPLERITVAEAPKNEYFVGKSITEIADMFGVTPVKALLKTMDTTGLHATVFNENINFEELTKLMSHPRALIASNSASRRPSKKFMPNERSTGTFPKYLELVLSGKFATLTEAIRKITSKPAGYFNIKDRGVIKEGKVADLVILRKEDYKVINTIVGGKTSGKGQVLRHAIENR